MKIIIIVSIITLLYGGIVGARIYGRFRISKELVQNTKSFSYTNPSATKKLLVVGDSTAVGIGSMDPNKSIAGRFHADYADFSIENRGSSGQKLSDTLDTLRQVSGTYDIILVQSGANDILFGTPKHDAIARARAVVREAKNHADTVVFLTAGNIGLAPLIPQPFGWLYEWRSRQFLEEFRKMSGEESVLFIDLYTTRAEDVMRADIDRYYANDLLHLTGDGYGVWYNVIITELEEKKIIKKIIQ